MVAATIATPGAGQTTGTSPAVEPIVAVRYRGTPAGHPRQDDLALLRALGFTAIVWTYDDEARGRELDRFARLVSLIVVPAGGRLDLGAPTIIDIQQSAPGLIPASVWLPIADGRRLVVIDAGSATGAGVHDADGGLAGWVRPAVAVTRQVEGNAQLVGRLRPGPALTVGADAAGSPARVQLLDGGRAWVLIAANPSNTTALALAELPRTVPYGPWVSLVDGHNMSMLVRRESHEYRAALEPGEARVYVIDKGNADDGSGVRGPVDGSRDSDSTDFALRPARVAGPAGNGRVADFDERPHLMARTAWNPV